jgi:hypothetical protein
MLWEEVITYFPLIGHGFIYQAVAYQRRKYRLMGLISAVRR